MNSRRTRVSVGIVATYRKRRVILTRKLVEAKLRRHPPGRFITMLRLVTQARHLHLRHLRRQEEMSEKSGKMSLPGFLCMEGV